tara:strand:- start:149 stop:700 length:552 start_codon:yes stop_codon:yes gene_type:complete
MNKQLVKCRNVNKLDLCVEIEPEINVYETTYKCIVKAIRYDLMCECENKDDYWYDEDSCSKCMYKKIIEEYYYVQVSATVEDMYDDLFKKLSKELNKIKGCTQCGCPSYFTTCGECKLQTQVNNHGKLISSKCVFCWEGIHDHDKYELSCGHTFHRICFKKWKKNCPLCRQETDYYEETKGVS